MTESELASVELTAMMNDPDAETFFSKRWAAFMVLSKEDLCLSLP
jgi:hypothetical protein